MIKILIVDDVDLIRVEICNQLKQYAKDVEVVGEAYSVKTALEQIDILQPDVLFLDIDLGDGTGFDILQKIDYTKYKIVFITSFDNYAIKAFKFNAIDYILKPFDAEELKNIIGKIKIQISKDELETKYQSLVDNLKSINKKTEYIILKNATELHKILVKDILYCQAESNYTKVCLNNGKIILMSKPLKEYEALLNEHSFFRIHQSYLINLSFVDVVKTNKNANVVLTNDTELPISFRKKQEFKAMLLNKKTDL